MSTRIACMSAVASAVLLSANAHAGTIADQFHGGAFCVPWSAPPNPRQNQ